MLSVVCVGIVLFLHIATRKGDNERSYGKAYGYFAISNVGNFWFILDDTFGFKKKDILIDEDWLDLYKPVQYEQDIET